MPKAKTAATMAPSVTGRFFTIVRHKTEPGNFMLRTVELKDGDVITVSDDVQDLLEMKLAKINEALRDAAIGRPTVI